MVRIPIHPGKFLAEELEALGISANQLAKVLGVPTNRLTEIIRGRRGISGDTVLRLGRWYGTGPDFWMNLHLPPEIFCAEYPLNISISGSGEHDFK